LLVTNGTPSTAFPEGELCTLTGLTDYFVDSAVLTQSKSAKRLSVSLTKIIL